MRYAEGQEETLKNCTQRRVKLKAGHLPKPKKCSVSSSSWHERTGRRCDVIIGIWK